MSYKVKIKEILSLTHNVKRFITEKPDDYNFKPGQATEVAIDHPELQEETRPFTFTSTPDDEFLEFTIKSYRDHDGVTKKIDGLTEGDAFLIGEPWGAIQYSGKGVFIAGGAGVTPFISILRDLEKKGSLQDHALIFSNLTAKDVIMEAEFQKMLGDHFISTLTHEDVEGHDHRFINRDFLQDYIEDFKQEFYVCGPPRMIEDINTHLKHLGAEAENVVFEE